MARDNYEIRDAYGDWALDIKMGATTVVLYFNSRSNVELVKSVLEWEDAHPNEAVPFMTTFAMLNKLPSRLKELDELYTKVQMVTGFTVEQLLDMFLAGYTLENRTVKCDELAKSLKKEFWETQPFKAIMKFAERTLDFIDRSLRSANQKKEKMNDETG